jgi:hypothetical protein
VSAVHRYLHQRPTVTVVLGFLVQSQRPRISHCDCGGLLYPAIFSA